MEFCVDVQCFKLSRSVLVCKELSIAPLVHTDEQSTTFLFKPVCSWNKLLNFEKVTNKWVIKNVHCIPWDSGEVSVKDFKKILYQHLKYAKKVWVKRAEKAEYIRDALPPQM